MRLFIAINFTEDVKNELCLTMERLKSYANQGNFTRRENLHLTLVFLGEVAPESIRNIKSAMEKVIVAKFLLSLSGLGYFKRNGGDIYWMGVESNNSLAALHSQLSRGLTQAGFTLDNREYKPHLTLGREIRLIDRFDYEAFAKTIKPLNQEVDKISLMKSERIKGRLIYSEIYAKLL
jgi:2'-5' RNA ligase